MHGIGSCEGSADHWREDGDTGLIKASESQVASQRGLGCRSSAGLRRGSSPATDQPRLDRRRIIRSGAVIRHDTRGPHVPGLIRGLEQIADRDGKLRVDASELIWQRVQTWPSRRERHGAPLDQAGDAPRTLGSGGVELRDGRIALAVTD